MNQAWRLRFHEVFDKRRGSFEIRAKEIMGIYGSVMRRHDLVGRRCSGSTIDSEGGGHNQCEGKRRSLGRYR